MKKFLIITVVILAIALVAYLVYRKFAKPVEETDVAETTTLSQTPITGELESSEVQVLDAGKLNSPR
jgi:uncharacterized protein YpmB